MFRNFKLLAATSLMLCAQAVAEQTMFEDGEFRPYEAVNVESDALTESVKDRVLYFAQFTCPYCRQAHDYVTEWGSALPRPYAMEVVPAVGFAEHIPMAMAYYIVLEADPRKLRAYEERLYRTLQDEHRNPVDPETYEDAAAAVGIDRETFRGLASDERIRSYVMRAKALTERYGIDEVPTVVVASRFKTTPGRVYNEQQAFVGLLNGLISMDFTERFER